MKKMSLSALAAAGLLVGGLTTSASAADLGGDCCADLEERVAELEATTARKGNRKVSLTISGWVGEEIMYWDDGRESNLYQTGLGSTLSSNFKLSGQAQITPGWTAGYLIHVEVSTADNLTTSADNDDGPKVNVGTARDASNIVGASSMSMVQSYWFIKSDKLGKVSVGQHSQASDNTAILVDGSGSLVAANWVAFGHNSFAVQNDGGVALSWGNAGSCRGMGGAWGDCNGLLANGVRYDSPTFAGFSMSAGWGEDDYWDVALRYAGEFQGVKVAFAAAYNETNEFAVVPVVVGANSVQYFQLGVYAQHVPTGLFALYNFGYLDEEQDNAPNGRAEPPEATTHYVKAGLRRQFVPLGHTVLYAEYLKNDDGAVAVLGNGAGDSELDVWGLGAVQEIDAAAMSVFLRYRHLSFTDDTQTNYQDFDSVSIGGLINF